MTRNEGIQIEGETAREREGGNANSVEENHPLKGKE